MLMTKAPHWLGKVFQIQGTITLILGLIFIFISVETAYSIVLGGLVYGLPQYWSVRREFGTTTDSNKAGINAQLSLLQLYRLEVIKVALTVGLFIIVFASVKPINGLALLMVYAGLHMSAFILPLIIKRF